MGKRMWAVVAGVCALAFVLAVPGRAQQAKGWTPANQLIKDVQSSVSGAMRQMPKAKGPVSPPREQPNPRRGRPGANQQATTLAPIDSDLQSAPSGSLDTINGLDFEGIDFTGYYPPDTNAAVGNNTTGDDGQVVETVNTEYAVFNKATGQLEGGPVNISSLFANLGTACANAGNGTDPIVLFDQISDRWIVSLTAYPPLNYRNNLMCIAVSTTSDAAGSYYAYAVNFGRDFPDYPKLAVWPDGYYYSADMFRQNSSIYLGAVACAFNRGDLDSGTLSTASYQCFQGSASDYRLLPANLDGSTAPPTNAPDVFLELGSNNASLLLYKLYTPWSNGGAASFTLAATIPVATFTLACGSGGTCIPQKGTTNQLDSLGDGLMYPLEYRNFGNYDSLVVSQSVNTGLAAGNVGIRWYEIHNVDDSTSAPSVYQQSTYTGNDIQMGDYFYRWMGSIAEDQVGDLALGYSKSSSSLYPGISYTGQSATDQASGLRNEMESENDAFAGSGSETKASRWGDYSSMAVDPGDDCTFWYSTEYFPSNGISWNTRILSFNFPDCPTFSLSSPSPSQSITAGTDAQFTINVTDYSNLSQTVDFSPTAVYGLASGSSAQFDSSSVTGTGSVTLTISNTAGLASGTYPLYVVGTEGNAEKSVALTLVVSGGSSGGSSFAITSDPTSATIHPGGTATYNLTVTSIGSFSGNVTLSVTGLPKFASSRFSVNPVSVAAGGSANANLTVKTNRNVAPNPSGYQLTITGTSGSQTISTTVTLVVE